MAKVFGYVTYNFEGEKDPVIHELRELKEKHGMSVQNISEKSGVAPSTLHCWWTGKTRRPQSATVEAAGRALGYMRKWVRMKDE